MATKLFDVTQSVRKYLIYFVVFVGVVLLLQFCGGVISSLRQQQAAGPTGSYRLPDNKFGQVALPNLSNVKLADAASPEFTLDNLLPTISYKGVNVYKVEEPRERFGIEDAAKDVAQRLGFTTPLKRDPDEQTLVWEQTGKSLRFNKVTQAWVYFNGGVQLPGRFGVFSENPADYVNQAQQLAPLLGVTNGVFDFATTEVDYLVRKGNSYVSAANPKTAEYIKLRIYRRLEAVSLAPGIQASANTKALAASAVKDDYFTAPLEIITTAKVETALSLPEVVSFRWTNWQIDTSPGVYELYTPDEAWEKIRRGEGALKELSEFGFNRYEVGKLPNQNVLSFIANYQQVNLAYLEPDVWTGYLYPIYIFRGRAKLANSPDQPNADFVFYVNALKETNSRTAQP